MIQTFVKISGEVRPIEAIRNTTIQVRVTLCELEPGTHIARKIMREISQTEYSLPTEECLEARPDWGEYFPLPTFPAIERALRQRGAFNYPLPTDQVYRFGEVRFGPRQVEVKS